MLVLPEAYKILVNVVYDKYVRLKTYLSQQNNI